MAIKDKLQSIAQENDVLMWCVAFVGVCVLVGMGKLEAKTVEFMLFGLVGKAAFKRTQRREQEPEPEPETESEPDQEEPSLATAEDKAQVSSKVKPNA